MSLTPEYFDARDALILKREAEGDIELEHFLEDRGAQVDDLYELSLLKDDRGFITTADFCPHEVTPEGRRFLKSAAYQLIFVKRQRVADLTAFLSAAKASGDLTNQD
jgi:hypothetical protein